MSIKFVKRYLFQTKEGVRIYNSGDESETFPIDLGEKLVELGTAIICDHPPKDSKVSKVETKETLAKAKKVTETETKDPLAKLKRKFKKADD